MTKTIASVIDDTLHEIQKHGLKESSVTDYQNPFFSLFWNILSRKAMNIMTGNFWKNSFFITRPGEKMVRSVTPISHVSKKLYIYSFQLLKQGIQTSQCAAGLVLIPQRQSI